MTEESTVEPLTAEEEATLASLQYRAAMAAWQGNEQVRLAELAKIAPVAAALAPCEDVITALGEIEGLDAADQQKVDSLIRVTGFHSRNFMARHAALSQPDPQPEAPAE